MDQPTKIEVIARGIMFHKKHILLCRNRKHGYGYLPGGHVEPGESAARALAREMIEEAATTVVVHDVVVTEEHLFMQGGKPRHEFNVYMRMQCDAPEHVRSVEPHIEFVWVSLDELATTDVRPVHVKRLIDDVGAEKSLLWSSVTPA